MLAPNIPRSALPGTAWPSLLDNAGATKLAVLQQLEASQWMTPEQLQVQQAQQLQLLIQHANTTVPWFRGKLESKKLFPNGQLDMDAWRAIPILTRNILQKNFEQLQSQQLPPQHGEIQVTTTSGSTGTPVKVACSALHNFFWYVMTLREHQWHQRDFSLPLTSIRYFNPGRADYPDGGEQDKWGAPVSDIYKTGPSHILSIHASVHEQLEWLKTRDVGYLLSYPSNIAELARLCKQRDVSMKNIQHVRTVSEIVDQKLRDLCMDAWGAKIIDTYSIKEAGYVALQCPEHEHYHTQDETLFVEILDEQGNACQPGQIGRVIVTVLHNFAMPLIRYDLNDYAEVGEPCPCGRGLGTIKRILGRVRNMMILPDGSRKWPLYDHEALAKVVPLRRVQFVQTDREDITVNLEMDGEFTSNHERELTGIIRKNFGYPFKLTFRLHDEIARDVGGKFEDFKSELL